MDSFIERVASGAPALSLGLSLGNPHFDFSLIKVQAPQEYDRLALTISSRRKSDAEDGALHRTARRLGALFEGTLPSTPVLFRAYGKRVSEISSVAAVDPRFTDNSNIFASHLGLDTASIWAAATSGAGAIAVHLLACMLARMFTSSEAISVWVEIVEKQKEHIIQERENDLYTEKHDFLFFAARQEISRSDLANWDASARAWIQSADGAKECQHKQMMLILNNASIPVNEECTTYKSVMKAWIAALKAMESLLKGMPQRVQDGAALLGISSWHMYPDIHLFSNTTVEIKQKDPIFESTALLTLGLEVVNGSDKSVSWSLPLARLQYYGDPVQASRSTGPDNTRITPDQFSFIVLGCLFESWGSFGHDSQAALSWLDRIMTLIRQPLSVETANRRSQDHELFWLEYLDSAAQKLVKSQGLDRQLAWQLVSLGRRRSTFLYPPIQHPIPLFGISHLRYLVSFLKEDEIRLRLLRKYAARLNLEDKLYIIRYQPSRGPFAHEYASVQPKRERSLVGSSTASADKKYIRWLPLRQNDLEELCRDDCPAFRKLSPIWHRHDYLVQKGELCFPSPDTMGLDRSWPVLYRRSIKYDFITAARKLLQRWAGDDKSLLVHQPTFVTGTEKAAICRITFFQSQFTGRLAPEDLDGFLTPENIEATNVLEHVLSNAKISSDFRPLKACAAMSNIYKHLPGATISTLVLSQSLSEAKWASNSSTPMPALTMRQAFACISMFEIGTCNLDPAVLEEVFAISSGNSLFVTRTYLVDPYDEPDPTDIRRIVGNIGRPGLSLLVPPPKPKMRSADLGSWKQVNHFPFNGLAEDCFQTTSIHLSFSNYEMPLWNSELQNHTIDRPINLVESLVSVYDRGKWVADLDILKALNSYVFRQHCYSDVPGEAYQLSCAAKSSSSFSAVSQYCRQLKSTSIENWEELLDLPGRGTIVVRAHKNWLARLALSVICKSLGLEIIILGDDPCWKCCASYILTNLPNEASPEFKEMDEVSRDSIEVDEVPSIINVDDEDKSSVDGSEKSHGFSEDEMGSSDSDQENVTYEIGYENALEPEARKRTVSKDKNRRIAIIY